MFKKLTIQHREGERKIRCRVRFLGYFVINWGLFEQPLKLMRHSVSYHALYNNGEHTNHIEKRFTTIGKNQKRTRLVESSFQGPGNMPGVQQYPN
ncbi:MULTISPECIES: hypothetical protein [unclassified Paenibacillus]|uniref:hypothetical protein n=1 Tax=unclassified Paenibacillus TaxID=185978 RepID=UPI0015E28112|nr:MULTISPECIES: hypothetical protein [unclassified Paenibacillus]